MKTKKPSKAEWEQWLSEACDEIHAAWDQDSIFGDALRSDFQRFIFWEEMSKYTDPWSRCQAKAIEIEEQCRHYEKSKRSRNSSSTSTRARVVA